MQAFQAGFVIRGKGCEIAP